MSETVKTVLENPSAIYTLWAKLVRAKTYTKEVALRRVNVMYTAGQFTDEEYTSLIDLINTTYNEEA